MRKPSNPTLGGEAVRVTASKLIALCITMLTTMMLARFRSFDEYGTYSQLLLVVNLFTALLMLGLPNSINYFLARADTAPEKQRFLSVYYTMSTALSIVIGVLLMSAIPLIEAFFHNSGIRAFSYFLALYPWSHIISASIENVLVIYKKTRFLILYRVIYSAAMLGLVVIIQWRGYGFKTYMGCFVALNGLFAVAVYLIAGYCSGGIKPLLDRQLIVAILTFSIPIGLSGAVGTLNAEIDKLLIGYLMSTAELAIYTNAAKELPFTIIASSITAVLLPRMTRMLKKGRNADAVTLWATATELAFIIIALAVAGVFTYAEEVMTILYSAKYLPGVNVFRVYTLNLLLRCTYFGMILNACGETKKIFYCSVLSLILNVILNPFFYWLFGMIGPAIASFLAILAVLLFQLKLTSRAVGIPFGRIFPWGRAAQILTVNLVFALVFCYLKTALPLESLFGGTGEAVALGAVWSLLYFAFMKKRMVLRWQTLNKKENDI